MYMEDYEEELQGKGANLAGNLAGVWRAVGGVRTAG